MPARVEGQQAALRLEQRDGLGGRGPGQRPVRAAVDDLVGDVRVRVAVGRVELAQPDPHGEGPAHRPVHVTRVDQPAPHRLVDPGDGHVGAVVEVGEAVDAGPQGGGVALRVVGVGGLLARVGQVARRVRVGDDEDLAVGPGAQLVVQVRGDVRRPPVDQVVGGHHGHRRPALDGRAEGRKFVLVQHPRPEVARGGAPVGLVVVAQEVLQRRRGPQHPRVVAGQPPGVRVAEQPGQVRVLGVPLLVAPPPRVAQRVDHRGPDVEPAPRRVLVVQPPHLVTGGRADPPYQIQVPTGGQADGLREHGGLAVPGEPVQGLGAGGERGQAEPVDGRLVLVQHRHLLRQGEPGEQVVDALGERHVGPAETGVLGHGGHIRVSKRFDGGAGGTCRRDFRELTTCLPELIRIVKRHRSMADAE